MELTLNLVWVCVAIAGILAQIVMLERAARTDRPGNAWRKIVAMGCALIILFFVISMTDDLHDQVLVWEESKHSRVSPGVKASTNPAFHGSNSGDFHVFVVPAASPAPSLRWSRLETLSGLLLVPAPVHAIFSGRAPPLFLA